LRDGVTERDHVSLTETSAQGERKRNFADMGTWKKNKIVFYGRIIALAALVFLSSLAARARQGNSGSFSARETFAGQTTQDYNSTIHTTLQLNASDPGYLPRDYQVGPEDLLHISVLEAPDLSCTARVGEDGRISLPLLGVLPAGGLTSRQLESNIESLLSRQYMKDPHVSVFVEEMHSHPVSVFGAVEKPGVFQIREAKPLIEILSMAQGLAPDAGDTVIVMRHPGDPGTGTGPLAVSSALERGSGTQPAVHRHSPSQASLVSIAKEESVEVSLKELLDSGDSRYDPLVYPGDVVKVTRAGVVYVVGQVRRPGGFLLKTNENISVLQALALAEGLTSTAQGKRARIIFSGADGARTETAINLDNILKGKAPDPLLQANDILFVPNSSRKAAWHGFTQSTGGIAMAIAGASVYRW
jgi:polysaccharide export outer membrane protein